MKLAYFCTNTYAEPELFGRNSGWPFPPREYDPAIGVRSVDYALEQAVAAEDMGFDWITASEHHYWPICQTPNAGIMLGALSQVVKKARIGWMGPLVSMNNPVRVAEEVGMLDQLTRGRLVVLYLRGTPNEFLAYHVRPDETRPRTQEAAELIARALTEPEVFSWEGRYFRYRTVAVWPQPTQKPMPPVYWSGNSMESATYAAKHGYGMGMSYFPMHLCAKMAAFYRSECERFGWTPSPEHILYRCFIGITDSDDQTPEMAMRFFSGGPGLGAVAGGRGKLTASLLKAPEPPQPTQPKELGTDADGKNVEADKGNSPQGFALGQLTFKGSPETVVNQIREFHEHVGNGVLDLSFSGGGLPQEETMRSLRLFGEEVLPRIHDLGTTANVKEVSGVAG